MRDKRPSLILYITALVLVMAAKVFDLETLMLVCKPIVVPAIYYYYLQCKRGKANWLFSVGVWSFFAADMIMVLYSKTAILAIMACGMVSYLVLAFFAFKDSGKIKFRSLNVIFLTLLLLLPGYVLFTILNINTEEIANHYAVYLMYGIILFTLTGVSVYNYLSNPTSCFLYLCLMSVCLLISDVFYCINKYMIDLPVIDNLNLLAQLVSYFFMVKYFTSRKRGNVAGKIKSLHNGSID